MPRSVPSITQRIWTEWRHKLAEPEQTDTQDGRPPASWEQLQAGLAHVARAQLFFVGGAPRSGTTWLQEMLDSHPVVSCGGEGLFYHHLAKPLDEMMARRAAAIEGKNRRIFGHNGGYSLPISADADLLLGTAILAAMHRQAAGKRYLALGEKTPENVFAFKRLRTIFPHAKLIGIVRDPRDVLASSWHFFQSVPPGTEEAAAKYRFVQASLPSMARGIKTLLDQADADPSACKVVRYEQLLAAPAAELARLFAFLGIPDHPALVADCVERTRFARASGGRAAGEVRDGAFHRAGVAGGWRGTFGPEVDALVQEHLGWAFPILGWQR